ncbi:hypothetical protein PACTADRAFT_73642 [Pachysolen tannophilus NRRL Y-2460]|uniref:PSP1 C-terminal domain-containing protein n=1 Tax=Pachysolen tannophilus NRRL Y-2460 TaxID=669874 RepID=A0A1E4U1W3_PACTA|nr:hypothetical protein PACTADRAFT_73642 [Pachysolen tannophilus NRRL Y-2460]
MSQQQVLFNNQLAKMLNSLKSSASPDVFISQNDNNSSMGHVAGGLFGNNTSGNPYTTNDVFNLNSIGNSHGFNNDYNNYNNSSSSGGSGGSATSYSHYSNYPQVSSSLSSANSSNNNNNGNGNFDPFSPSNSLRSPILTSGNLGGGSATNNSFNLPLELQGGVSNISSRRPSYAAELVYNNRPINDFNMNTISEVPFLNTALFDHQQQQQVQQQQQQPQQQVQQMQQHQHQHSNSNSGVFPSRARPSTQPIANGNGVFQTQQQQQQQQQMNQHQQMNQQMNQLANSNGLIQLDNGLLLNNSFIIASQELKNQYHKTINYFGDLEVSKTIVDQLNELVNFNNTNIVNQRVMKLISYLKSQNDDLKFQQKNYTLILNKNNKIDLISIPKNSNLKLDKNDLIIIEGDRGKDLVLVLEPIISLNFAILFNYLKKKLHLKSLTYGQEPIINNLHTSPTLNNPQQPINEDENFITLPNKQVLRFVKPFEINQLYLKFNDELLALKLCLNYVTNLNLKLIVKNVEFQFDKKKIIVYYYCDKRLDFRGLIKELFKVYKTRIWLCAVLPTDSEANNIIESCKKLNNENTTQQKQQQQQQQQGSSSMGRLSNGNGNGNSNNNNNNALNLSNILKLPQEINSVEEFPMIRPIKFHGEIFISLIRDFINELSLEERFIENYYFLVNSDRNNHQQQQTLQQKENDLNNSGNTSTRNNSDSIIDYNNYNNLNNNRFATNIANIASFTPSFDTNLFSPQSASSDHRSGM